jgi:hypothetical protein
MRQIIGNADEFYRLRVVTFDASDAPDLDWREDILWRRPVTAGVSESVLQRLEAVEIADGETAWTLGEFATTSDAHAAMQEVDFDLRGMTKSQFEDAYLGCGTSDVATVPMPERTPIDTGD